MSRRHVLYEIEGADPAVTSLWYGGEDTIAPPEPELVIDLGRLLGDRDELREDVFAFLREHGLDVKRSTDMADRLITALPMLHPATLGVIVCSLGAGHWQIVAERGQ